MSTPITFTRAKAASRDLLCVAAIPDDAEVFTQFTRLCRYDHSDPGPVRWFFDDFDLAVTSIARPTLWGRPYFCLLSAEGDVVLRRSPPPFPCEKIPGAGIATKDSKYWGRMSYLGLIGAHLYACGDGGQVYKRVGADFGSGRWEHLDTSLLQDPKVRTEALLKNPKSREADKKVYFCVNGPHEEEIYVCGTKGTILAWNGSSFASLPPVTDAALVKILVEDERRIWICGREGVLLRGNRHDGFRSVTMSSGRQLFTSITSYDGRIYLASNADPRGLFVYHRGRLDRVWSGLKPDILDVHTVDSSEGVLWVVGSKDIVRFDGTHWERIDHVDNVPIR